MCELGSRMQTEMGSTGSSVPKQLLSSWLLAGPSLLQLQDSSVWVVFIFIPSVRVVVMESHTWMAAHGSSRAVEVELRCD